MIKKLLYVLILLYSGYPMVAQDMMESKHRIGLHSGIMFYHGYDPILASLSIKSTLFTVGLNADFVKENKRYWGFELNTFSKGELSTNPSVANGFIKGSGDMFGRHLGIYYRKTLPVSKKRLQVGVQLDANYFDKRFITLLDDEGRSGDVLLSLGPSILYRINKEKHQLSTGINFLLLGYAAAQTRNAETEPIELIDKKLTVFTVLPYGQFTAPWNSVNLTYRISYRYRLSKLFFTGLQYHFQYYRYNKSIPQYVQSVNYQIKAVFGVRL